MSGPQLKVVPDDRADRLMPAWMFLHALDPDVTEFCFQTFDDVVLEDGKPRNKTGLARTLHGNVSDMWGELCELNKLGAGIFFTVNSIEPGARRANKNVKRCRAVWCEHDGGLLPDFPLEPSLIVETSPGKHHFYWLVADELSPEQHQQIMRVMCDHYGSDPNAKDLARVLRLPGTHHRKAGAFEVTFDECARDADGMALRYTAAELVEAFQAEPQEPTATAASTVERQPANGQHVRDALKHIRAEDLDDRHVWLKLGMALHHEFGEEGRELWDEVSERSHKFNPEDQDKTWLSFEGRRSNTIVTAATIFHYASKGGWKRPRASAEEEFGDIEPEVASSSKTATEAFSVRAYKWRDPRTIPPREWLGRNRHLIRGFVSATVSPGGVGKTALSITEALEMVTGKSLLRPGASATPLRVYLWNGENPQDELDRRVQAACLQFGVTEADIGGRLFVASGRDRKLMLATETRSGVQVTEPLVSAMIEHFRTNSIDVAIIDPFVRSHRVSENDNGKIDAVMDQFRRVADGGAMCC